MPFFLKHYFNPGFDYSHLRPKELSCGKVDHYNLGYVQNAVAGEVLAEWVEISEDKTAAYHPEFIYEQKKFPLGWGTKVNPDNVDQLVATTNGYVFYNEDGLICVKRVLNVRRDVDFNTGNILYVGDMVVHGSVKSGFKIRAANILVRQSIEGAHLSSMGSIVSQGGVKGAKTAYIEAGQSMRLAFAENATLKASENVLIDGNSFHNTVFCGGKMAVKSRMIGGSTFCYKTVYVAEQLGGGISTTTKIVLGFDPLLLKDDIELTSEIKKLEEKHKYYLAQTQKGGIPEQEFAPKLARAEKKLGLLRLRKVKIWDKISKTEVLNECRLIVPGTIKPGVELSIGTNHLKIQDFYQDVQFRLVDNEIKMTSPALT